MPWAFGCAKLPPQFATVATGISLPPALTPLAAEILAFDLLIANSDRRAQNPNCLFNGKELAIYDHELAFLIEGVIGWRPPWEEGGIYFAPGQNRHLFLDAVRGMTHDFSRLQGALEAITPGRVEEYRSSLPEEWGREDDATDRMVAYIKQLSSHAAVALQQIQTSLR